MKDLIDKIEQLEKQLAEKEHEIQLIKDDVEAIRAALEASIEERLTKESEPEKTEVQEIVEEVIADSVIEAAEVSEEKVEISDEVEEQQHVAIMRTIEEFSQDQQRSTSTFQTSHEKTTLAERVSQSPLNDIKKAIGINERFLYANILFNGDMSAFSKAVEELNHLESILDANRLMDEELSPRYKWDEENETVVAFKTLVSRRFS